MMNSTNWLIILNISYLNEIIKSLKASGGRSVSMWTTKCRTLMESLFWKLSEENGVGTHCLTSSQQFPICRPLPTPFLWTHNNNEAITICDRICNMEMVGMFYLVSWYARFLKTSHIFKRDKHSPSPPIAWHYKKNSQVMAF